MSKSNTTICYHRGCKRTVPGAPGPRYCRDHAAERVAELREELKVLQDAYGEAAKSSRVKELKRGHQEISRR
jgi:hypothetical protein